MSLDNRDNIVAVDFECPSCKKAASEAKSVPIRRIIEKLDLCFSRNDLSAAQNLLEAWQKEAELLGDNKGELSIVNEMLGLYRRTNDKEKAEAAIKRAKVLLEATHSLDNISGATIMLNAATTCKAFGLYESALRLYDAAEKIYEAKLSKSDLKFAAFYNNKATTLVDLERLDEAIELYRRAIALTERSPQSYLDCAVSYVNLAHLYEKKEGALSDNIARCLTKAQALLENNQVKHNSYYAFVCEKCAPSFDYFGFFSIAAQLLKESKEIYERP